jgi:hypothetical protein
MRASSVRAEARVLKSPHQPDPSRFDDATKSPVRERPAVLGLSEECQDGAKRPAHLSNRLIAQLNERWRVVDDPLQWILQRKKGNPRKKSSGWRGRSFCRTREALLRCVREYCGEIEIDALARLDELPEWHVDWDVTNLDVPGTDQAQAGKQSKPLVSEALEVPDAAE